MKPIRTESDYQAALDRLEDLVVGFQRCQDEIEVLSTLIKVYEEQQFPTPLPTAIEAIKFRMDQGGLKPKDLIPHLGSRSKVSEVLSGKRALSLAMIRKLHAGLGIPAAALIKEQTL